MPAYIDPRTGHAFFKKQVRLPDGTSVRISGVPKDYGQKDNKTGAKKAEQIAVGRLLSTGTTAPTPPPPAAPRVPTVAEYLPIWLAEAEVANAEGTVDRKRVAANYHIGPAFGHLRLDEITFAHVNDWRRDLLKPPDDPATGRPVRKKLHPETVKGLLSMFHGFLNFAVANEVIARLPTKWPKVEVPEKLPVFLSFEAADQLIAAPSPPGWSSWQWRVMHAMVVVAIRAGLRIGELRALRWQNVDLEHGVLWVRESISRRGTRKAPKGKKPRKLPLTNDAINALRSIRQDRWESVFTINGSVLGRNEVTSLLTQMCRSAGMLSFGWHRLRHTFASHLVMRGVHLLTVMKYMGHVNMRDTLRYAHLSPEVEHEAIMVLDHPAPTTGRGKQTRRRRARPAETTSGSTVAAESGSSLL